MYVCSAWNPNQVSTNYKYGMKFAKADISKYTKVNVHVNIGSYSSTFLMGADTTTLSTGGNLDTDITIPSFSNYLYIGYLTALVKNGYGEFTITFS